MTHLNDLTLLERQTQHTWLQDDWSGLKQSSDHHQEGGHSAEKTLWIAPQDRSCLDSPCFGMVPVDCFSRANCSLEVVYVAQPCEYNLGNRCYINTTGSNSQSDKVFLAKKQTDRHLQMCKLTGICKFAGLNLLWDTLQTEFGVIVSKEASLYVTQSRKLAHEYSNSRQNSAGQGSKGEMFLWRYNVQSANHIHI